MVNFSRFPLNNFVYLNLIHVIKLTLYVYYTYVYNVIYRLQQREKYPNTCKYLTMKPLLDTSVKQSNKLQMCRGYRKLFYRNHVYIIGLSRQFDN